MSNVEALSGSASSLEKVRRTSSNRFEIEKVEENILSKPSLPEVFNEIDEKPRPSSHSGASDPTKIGHPSALKKTVKHFNYDDDFQFDLDSTQNTVTKLDKSRYSFPKKSSNLDEHEPLTSKNDTQDDQSVDIQGGNCFQINYDEKNDPIAITCNLNSDGVTSYKTCVHDFKTIALYQKLIAEFIGTLILTLYACSIGLPIAEKNVPSLNGCLGGGLTLATLVWCLGNVSGGHFNPAVTIAFLFTGKLNPLLTVLYVGSQLVGSLTGAVILQSVVSLEASGNLSVTEIHKDITLSQAFGVELIITFILVLTIFSCVDTRRNDLHGSFPLQIGLAVVVGGLFGGRFTGGSMNPARSFGPALATRIWKDHWVYWVGPITGGVLAGIIYQFLLTLKCPRKTVPRSNSKNVV